VVPPPYSKTEGSPFGDEDLRRIQTASQRSFFRLLGTGSRGARTEFLVGGIQATLVPVQPWLAIFNSVFFEDPRALDSALPEIAALYRDAEIHAWSVWIPPGLGDECDKSLAGADLRVDSTPMLMAAPISELDHRPRGGIDLVDAPTWQMLAECNDRAYGMLDDWGLRNLFGDIRDPVTRLYIARSAGVAESGLLTREVDGDCHIYFVATKPDARGKGRASELLRVALDGAVSRGCTTSSLESSEMAEALYLSLGYRPLGRYRRWEHRDEV
jgi:ribosomal protein S18 acetylase RimI-like enzyme